MMEIWQDFVRFEYANEILVVVGVFLVLIGGFKVLRNAFRVIFWVFLVGLGAASVAYGWDRMSVPLPFNLSREMQNLIGPGRELTDDAIREICSRLDTPGSGK